MSSRKRGKIVLPDIPYDIYCSIIEFCTLKEFLVLKKVVRGLMNHIVKIRPSCLNHVPFPLINIPKTLPNTYVRNLLVPSLLAVDHFKKKYFEKKTMSREEGYGNRGEDLVDFYRGIHSNGGVCILAELSKMFRKLVCLNMDCLLPDQLIDPGMKKMKEDSLCFDSLSCLKIMRGAYYYYGGQETTSKICCHPKNFPRLKKLHLKKFNLRISLSSLHRLEELELKECSLAVLSGDKIIDDFQFCNLNRTRRIHLSLVDLSGGNTGESKGSISFEKCQLLEDLYVCNCVDRLVLSDLSRLKKFEAEGQDVIEVSNVPIIETLDYYNECLDLDKFFNLASNTPMLKNLSIYVISETMKLSQFTRQLFEEMSFFNLEKLSIEAIRGANIGGGLTIKLHDLLKLKSARLRGVSVSSFKNLPSLRTVKFGEGNGSILGPFLGSGNRLGSIWYYGDEDRFWDMFLKGSEIYLEEVVMSTNIEEDFTLSGSRWSLIQKIGKLKLRDVECFFDNF